MDKERWAQRESKVAGANHVVVCTEFLSNDYKEPTFPESGRALENALLVFFEIQPRRGGFPTFRARWDERGKTVDFDLCGSDEESRMFATREDGYIGHKTTKVSDSPSRIWEAHIVTPDTGPVFKGKIKLCLAFEAALAAGLYAISGMDAEATVRRAADNEGK